MTLAALELPYFERATPESIARARKDEVSFDRFRAKLGEALREIEQVADGPDALVRRDEIIRDVIRAPLAEIRMTSARLRRKFLGQAAVSVGTLAALASAATYGGQWPPGLLALLTIAGLTEFARVLGSQVSERDSLQERFGFFYWQAVKKPKK